MPPVRLSPTRRRDGAVAQALYGGMQCCFAVAVMLIFAITIAVNAQTLHLPDWTRSLTDYSPSERNRYAAALLGPVCVLAALFFAAGWQQLRQDAWLNPSYRWPVA